MRALQDDHSRRLYFFVDSLAAMECPTHPNYKSNHFLHKDLTLLTEECSARGVLNSNSMLALQNFKYFVSFLFVSVVISSVSVRTIRLIGTLRWESCCFVLQWSIFRQLLKVLICYETQGNMRKHDIPISCINYRFLTFCLHVPLITCITY
jgi:hypothetical protein